MSYIYEIMHPIHIMGKIMTCEYIDWDSKQRKFYSRKGLKAVLPQFFVGFFYTIALIDAVPTKENKSTYTDVVYSLESIVVLLMYWSLAFWTYFAQDNILTLYEAISNLDKEFELYGIHLSERKMHKKLGYTVELMLVIIITTGPPAVYTYITKAYRKSLILKHPVGMVALYRLYNIAAIFFILRDRFILINEILSEMIGKKCLNSDLKFLRISQEVVRDLKEFWLKIFQYPIFIFLTIVNLLEMALNFVYWIEITFIGLSSRGSQVYVQTAITCILFFYGAFCLILCEEARCKTLETSRIIHRIYLHNSNRSDIKIEIKSFSKSLKSNRIQFVVYGIYELTPSVYLGALASIVNMGMLMVQFKVYI